MAKISPLKDFCVFILTHGRPERVRTYETLRKQNYRGKIYLIVDDEDQKLPEYQERFGDQVIVFNKKEIADRYDTGDNFTDRRAVFFARNACFKIAKRLGVSYFLELDDDYTAFYYKFSPSLTFADRLAKDLDRLFATVLNYFKKIPAVTIAFGQGGDILGGGRSGTLKKIWLKRKAMNTFFCATDRPFDFVGRINEDVNTYVSEGNRGKLFFTMFNAAICQIQTQGNAGGMTELYANEGTYRKTFYAIMYAPSCIKIYTMGNKQKRIHHKVKWENAVPMILPERFKK